jgi:N-acetylglucosaminyldiphosphoundecaprenol N-acetyl-beta-D-mannosaminyltransferase
MPQLPQSVNIGRIPVHLFTVNSLHAAINNVIEKNGKAKVLHANAYLVSLANTSEHWYLPFYNEKVDMCMCDGAGIQLAAKLTGQRVPEKITYNIWFYEFATFCAQNNYSIFLLGSKPNVAELAIEELTKLNPTLELYCHHGYFNKEKSHPENKKVIETINKVKPNVVLVAFGMPLQEKWILENFEDVEANIFLTGGAAIDYMAKIVKNAPVIFSKIYLEWFYRLLREPKRLGRRYTIGNYHFLKAALKYGKRPF